MKQEDFKLIKISADEGRYLTQVEEVPDADRFYSTEIYLAVNDSPENYRDADQEEKDAWQLRMDEELARHDAEKNIDIEGGN